MTGRLAAMLAAALALSAASAQPAAPPIDRARLEARLAAVQVLIEQSSAARQVESSGNARAIERRAQAREVRARAQRAFDVGDLEGAGRLLPEASMLMFEAVRLAAPEQVAADKWRADFDARLQSVQSLAAAQRRIAAEKPGIAGAREATASVDKLVAEARELSGKGDPATARARLDEAYLVAKASIGALRGGDTLVRSLSFATRQEEYDYEVDRNDTHRMLIRLLLDARRGNPATDEMVRGSVERAQALRGQAEGASRQGDFAAAIKLLEQSTGELVRAIRGAGVFIPG